MLYLVATPIGNLKDITLRALETLQSVDLVVSEDTRKTGMLLHHFEMKKPQLSFREDNEKKALPKVMEHLRAGENVAIVTDAGSPSVSDPGFLLVRAAIEENIPITAIPGPTALIAALTLSGLPVHSFTFRGFPPRKPGPRKRFLAVDMNSPHTLIFYESPYRLIPFLEDALEVFGDRQSAVANDLTKLFEQLDRGTISELIANFKAKAPRGEYTVVINGLNTKNSPDADNNAEEEDID
ncbi:MAG: 16S rRNA (cytidine(1402)-2'-O)-methyltransferase [Flexilinea sp.]